MLGSLLRAYIRDEGVTEVGCDIQLTHIGRDLRHVLIFSTGRIFLTCGFSRGEGLVVGAKLARLTEILREITPEGQETISVMVDNCFYPLWACLNFPA